MNYENHPMKTLSIRGQLVQRNSLLSAALALFLYALAAPPAQGSGCPSTAFVASASAQELQSGKSSRRRTVSDWNSPVAPPEGPVIIRAASATGISANVSPAIIDETFRNFVQLSISGMATGDAVRVEKFQVNTSDGTIDTGAILQQSFLLIDGKSNVIDGIPNSNVPADTTPADGQIVAQISFLDDYVPSTVAEYVYRFSSPNNSFAPVTARFSVQAAASAQSITGTVLANGTPVPFATVALLDARGGTYDFVGATVCDAAGHYTIGAKPGVYDLVAVKRGFVGAFGRGIAHQLAPGVTATVNVQLEPSSRTVAGKVRDRSTGLGLPGVQVVFRSQEGKFTIDYTDAAGNFATPVAAAEWDVEVERKAVNQIGYVTPARPSQADTVAGNATDVVISMPKAAALLYGKLSDSTGAALANAEIDAVSGDGEFESFSVSDENGNYVIALSGGKWSVAPTAGPLLEAGYVSPSPLTVTLQDRQSTDNDFTVSPANATASGTLLDETGAPIEEATFYASEVGVQGRFTTFTTASDGTFDIGLSDGKWRLTPDFDEVAETYLSEFIFVLPADFTLAAGQVLTGLDVRVQEPTRHIRVQLKDDLGDPYEAARVRAEIEVGGQTYVAYVLTDEEGNASLPSFDGSWTLFIQGAELAADGYHTLPPQTVVVTGSDPALTFQLEPIASTGDTLVNLATRGTVQTGDNVLIGGFIITGDAPKKVLLRAIGPSLTNSGVNGALADPTLTLFDANNVQLGFSDNWATDPNRQAISDTGIAPTNDKEAAILRTLPPGNYTAKLGGAGNTTGVALVEIYDLDSFANSRLANIATRGRVRAGDDVLIGGYIVGGYLPQTLVIRAIGPSLSGFGITDALTDPSLTVFDAQGAPIISNDNWGTTQKQELIDTALAPTNSKEAALLVDLQPGNYTAIVSDANNGTGIGLVEIYNITP
jgi:hypothetical protein